MGWTLFYMLVILKIPLVAALIVIWYAIKEPEPDEERADGGGPRRDPPPRPRRPRRGPAGGACRPVPCSQTARSRLGRPAPSYVRRA